MDQVTDVADVPLYRLLVQAVEGYGLFLLDPAGRVISWNRGAARLKGYQPDEIIGRHFSILYPEEDRVAGVPEKGLREAREHGRFEGEGWRRRKDGSRFWAHVVITPIRAPDGKVIAYAKVSHDRTREYEAEQERDRLLASEREARATAERTAREEQALREAVGAVGAHHSRGEVVREIAESAVNATGAVGALVGEMDPSTRSIEVVASSGRVPPHRSTIPYEESFTKGITEDSVHPLVEEIGRYRGGLWPDGPPEEYRDWSMLAVPLRAGDEVMGTLALFRTPQEEVFSEEVAARATTFGELTGIALQKLQMLEEAKRWAERLERVAETRNRLMRGFSHDVKNPLGAADGNAQLLEDGILGELSERQLDSIRSIRRSIQASLRLIDDLLDVARAESGQIRLERAETDLADLVRQSCDDFRAQATSQRLSLDCRVNDVPTITTDPARVRQIVSNLLSNALKYTGEGGVVVETGRAAQRVFVRVCDTGPGISPEQQETIFEEFTRLEPDSPHGTGIGLAISRPIARMLGGDITVASEAGQGSAFTLWLPLSDPPS